MLLLDADGDRILPADLWLAFRQLDIAQAAAGFTPPPCSSLWTVPYPAPPGALMDAVLTVLPRGE